MSSIYTKPLGRWASEKPFKGDTLCQSIASELSQNGLVEMELANVDQLCGGAKNAAQSVVWLTDVPNRCFTMGAV